MPKTHLRRNIHTAVRMATPDNHLTCGQRFLMGFGEVFRWGYLIGRKVCLVKDKKNFGPLVAGSILDSALGNLPSVQQIARIVFGTLSIMRCAEDLVELKNIGRKIKSLFLGKEYITVKKDNWDSLKKRKVSASFADRWRWFWRVYMKQVKEAFRMIGVWFKRLFLLGLHLADSYSAFKNRHVAEIFVHARDLWNTLTSSKSHLRNQLERSKKINDYMLKKMGSKHRTSFFLNLALLPAKIKQAFPDIRDVKESIAKGTDKLQMRVDAVGEELRVRYQQFLDDIGLSFKMNPALVLPRLPRRFRVFQKGSVDDPSAMRFIHVKNIYS